MKQSLQLRIGQSLTMTPQLQQAIKLLQMSTLDLHEEIERTLEENPLLEREEELEHYAEPEVTETVNDMDYDAIEVAVETQWSDTDHLDSVRPMTRTASDEEMESFESRTAVTTTLADHLLWQLNLMPLTERDQLIAVVLVDSLNEDGFLEAQLDEIHESLADDLPDIEDDEILCVLHQIQRLDPVGVACWTLQETLLIQLEQIQQLGGDVTLPHTIIRDYIDILGKRDRIGLKRVLKCDDDALDSALALIRSLDPKPGSHIGSEDSEYVIPDLIVRRTEEGWMVELNPDAMPRVSINDAYANLVRSGDQSETGQYLKTQLQEARWFVKSLRSRAETLLKVGTCIVEAQTGFFELGPLAMKPMILADIAKKVDMHESTISRVTTQKYMHTPRGTLELKYFFSSHVGTDDGGEASSTAIKAHLEALIGAEDPRKPLSDAKLSALLAERSFHVARRTVAKYREMLGISGSSERKQLV
ncbi:MAG: RNA polymerase factor sigma-54 [Litorivicinaceae bacterium]|jgi:RNA polymerase sigma-54 factor|nr:RNA polymerase factor sigma-54 [Litorivicinaceae bacterium]MDP5328510.1 RNA polymerase factor sigma-54 [Litorivicinaceae bacterium]MDP5330457.1 RNA polymerase factor sigma-54 [Litorivicinaceae bacterium]MDP5342063.1 RNA polymerase factor sigma-54 [Litorivicinaceae bacterium]MDP5343222.1 RNA polymerase factor sigma-54 [Litorivicinaceae bacterium]